MRGSPDRSTSRANARDHVWVPAAPVGHREHEAAVMPLRTGAQALLDLMCALRSEHADCCRVDVNDPA
jgi:hypothetical protein